MKKIIISPIIALLIFHLSSIDSMPEPLNIDYAHDIVTLPSSDTTFSLTFCRDTMGHFCLYMLLAFTLFFDLRRHFSLPRTRVAAVTLLTGIAYGITMEFVQKNFFPPRSFEWSDIAANSLGCALGCIAALYFSRKRETSQR